MKRLGRLLLIFSIVGLIISPTLAQCASRPDPYEQAMSRMRRLCNSPNVKLLPFGRSSAGRRIPAFVISNFAVGSENKVRFLICAGQHGDEYGAVKSVLSVSESLASGTERGILARCYIVVVPIVNPDGVAASHRLNGLGVDINRDWMDLRTPEARFVDGIVKRWQPQALLDAHEWTDVSPVPGNEIEVAKCVSTNQSAAMQSLAFRVARNSGLSVIDCTPEASKSLFHRRYALLGYAAFLVETAWGESYAAKSRAYASAITTVADALTNDEEMPSSLSPSARNLDSKALGAYLAHLSDSSGNSSSAASSALLTALLLGGWVLIARLSKPASREDVVGWSRRFRKCSLDCDVRVDPLVRKRRPQPITAKSWARRRLRARYAAPVRKAPAQKSSGHIPQWPSASVPTYGWAQMNEYEPSPSDLRNRF